MIAGFSSAKQVLAGVADHPATELFCGYCLCLKLMGRQLIIHWILFVDGGDLSWACYLGMNSVAWEEGHQ